MENIIKRKYKQVLLFCLMVLSITVFSAQTVFAAPVHNPVTLDAAQVFSVQDGAAPVSQFSYRMTAETPDAPMPAGSSGDAYTFTINGTDSVSLGPIHFTSAGVYSYEITQVIGSQQEGYVYDREVYNLSVNVDAALNTDIIVQKSNGEKTQAILFENSFTLRPSDPSAMSDPPVKKTVIGNSDNKGTFTFKLEAGEKNNPMPSGSKDGVKMMNIIGPGEAEFGTWSYTKPGTYYYTVSEVNNGEKGYSYDTAVYTITDSVKNENGRLAVMRTVTNASQKPVENFTFVNKYKTPLGENGDAESSKGTGAGKGINGPKTGDDTNSVPLFIINVIAAFAAVGCIVYLLFDKHRIEN